MSISPDVSPLAAPADAASSNAAPVQALCANCSTPLLGPHCYACGQPVKGMVRHLSSIVADASDTILNVDSRIFRTLWPLFVRPGFLTDEYFAGKRVRYVTPFRLYFFLSVAAFFLIQFAMNDAGLDAIRVETIPLDSIASALTAEEVIAQRDDALTKLNADKTATGTSAWSQKLLDKSAEKVRKAADDRLAYLQRTAEAKPKGESPPLDRKAPSRNSLGFDLFDPEYDAKKNPLHMSWLPQFANDKLNQGIVRMQQNARKLRDDRDLKPLLSGMFGVLPQVLFVLMPVFALMLKVFYIFKRRLYMEHLIVALHSHAFIFLAMILMTTLGMAHAAVAKSADWLSAPFNWTIAALCIWLPLYLLLMQKKVYKQGWTLTLLKYSVIGICYTVLSTLGAVAAFLVSLATV